MVYCTQAECLYLPIQKNVPFALGGKGLIVITTFPIVVDIHQVIYNLSVDMFKDC